MVDLKGHKKLSELDAIFDKSRRKFNTEEEIKDKKMCKVEDNTECKLQIECSKKIRTLCGEQGIKGEDKIIKKLGITPQTYSKYLTGKQILKLDQVEEFAKILGVSPYYILGFTDNRYSQIPNTVFGLTDNAKNSFMRLYYGIEDEDLEEFDTNMKPSPKYKEILETFNLFVENYSNFCEFLTYQKQYVDTKQKINELDNNEKGLNNKLEKEDLDSKLLRN